MQYSQYESNGVTPVPNANAPILSTIGGEQGGRAPIVIEDKIIQAAGEAAPDNVETMADIGKAEPGRDIFAGEAVKDIKSSNVPVVVEPVREQKEISSVNVGISLSTATTSSRTSDGTVEESTGSAASVTASTQSDATIESNSAVAAAAAKLPAAGPLGEAELEAQKVANELYPDAEK